MISDKGRIAQATNVCRQIRDLGRSERVCVLLLDPVPRLQRATLSGLTVEVADAREFFWPPGVPRTGLKLWLPTHFAGDAYLLLDSDIIILSDAFFDAFAPVPMKMKLVQESALCWHAGNKGIIPEHHATIIGRTILQTGVMAFDRTFWQIHFKGIRDRIWSDPSEFGDMAAVNLFMADNPQLLEPVCEEACLVLRPTGLGSSTEVHLSRTIADSPNILYDGRRVLSVHYTHSKGKVCEYEHILRIVVRNELRP